MRYIYNFTQVLIVTWRRCKKGINYKAMHRRISPSAAYLSWLNDSDKLGVGRLRDYWRLRPIKLLDNWENYTRYRITPSILIHRRPPFLLSLYAWQCRCFHARRKSREIIVSKFCLGETVVLFPSSLSFSFRIVFKFCLGETVILFSFFLLSFWLRIYAINIEVSTVSIREL